MVVSSGFLDHVLTMERSDVYLRANGLISAGPAATVVAAAAAQLPQISSTLTRPQQVRSIKIAFVHSSFSERKR